MAYYLGLGTPLETPMGANTGCLATTPQDSKRTLYQVLMKADRGSVFPGLSTKIS